VKISSITISGAPWQWSNEHGEQEDGLHLEERSMALLTKQARIR
jgi:hypothetical protein